MASSKPNVSLMSDLIICLDFCMDRRLLGHALLRYSDVKPVLRLTEAIANIIFQNRAWLQERCPSSKERCSNIKNTFRDVTLHSTNPETSAQNLSRKDHRCLCVQQGKRQESTYEPGFPEALSLVIFYLLNVFSQLGLPSSSGILPNL